MTPDDLRDVLVYQCVNDRPTITASGIARVLPGFTVAQVEASIARLQVDELVAEDGGAGRWAITPPK